MSSTALALTGRGLHKRFLIKESKQTVTALQDVSLRLESGSLMALVGPDGAGKTTLLRLAAGLMTADEGELQVLGIDAAKDPQAIQNRISYMPQRFGLYEDLSVQENLDLYADLHGVPMQARRERYARLMEMTDLGRFTRRSAGKLSGGMKQKLGLACTLVRSPDLLLLDEPTVGVDPLSRQELWEILDTLVNEERLTVLVSTAYLDEAERCSQVLVLHEGKVIANGTPASIREQAAGLCFVAQPPADEPARIMQSRLLDDPDTLDAVPRGGEVRFIRKLSAVREPADTRIDALLQGASYQPVPPTLEDGFMVLLRSQDTRDLSQPAASAPIAARASPDEIVIEVRDLVRRFGDFIAVNNTTFSVRRGEIFGLLGPNGAGKTTTFRMLCGLLPASSGFLQVAGQNMRTARAQARGAIGYVSQKFALYGNLSVNENLEFFGGAYGLYGKRLRERMDVVMAQFDLQSQGGTPSGELPGGFKQRLAMATALLHEPEILFLDEPTSGADPLARREFWRRITALALTGTTVIITTHFMEEAEYCDRIVIQDAGTVLALGTPQEVRLQAGSTAGHPLDMEQSFIAIVEQARRNHGTSEQAA